MDKLNALGSSAIGIVEHTKSTGEEQRSLNCGDRSVINDPLVGRNDIFLPHLHIKLGIMKQFVKALDHDSDCFKYISAAFPGLS